MKASSISEIKNELLQVPPARLLEVCLRLARYKKENKELLSYLLFESHDEANYINNVKAAMEIQFEEINKSNVYFAKKSLRKILRTTSKYIRHTGSKQAEVELLVHFCKTLKGAGIAIHKNTALNNLYQAQLKKINKVMDTLHEDLQYEYAKELVLLQSL